MHVSHVLADIRIENGTDPTGRYSLRVTSEQQKDPYAYEVWFFDEKSGKRIGQANIEWFYATARSAAETIKIAWHSSGDFVSFSHRGTKHSMELFVYSLRDGKATSLEFANYMQNALGRVDAVEVALHSVSTPDRWDKDDLLVDYHFSVDHKDRGRFFYNAEIKFHLEHERQSTPRIQLTYVSQPTKDQ